MLGRGTSYRNKSPSIETSLAARDAFVDYVLRALQDGGLAKNRTPSELINFLQTTDHVTPFACYEALVRELGLVEASIERDHQFGIGYLESNMRAYVAGNDVSIAPPGDPAITEAVHRINQTLGWGQQNDFVALAIVGPAHDGKKAVVGDLLRRLRKEDPAEGRFAVVGGAGTRHLPVLCLNAAIRDAHSLFVNVIVFLKRARQELEGAQAECVDAMLRSFDLPAAPPSIESLSREVDELLEKGDTPPVFIILLDVETRRDDLSRLIRRNDTTRLINAIVQSKKPDTRLLVTGSQRPSEFPQSQSTIELDRPRGARLAWYLKPNLQFDFEHLRATHDSYNNFANVTSSGDVLLVLAIAMSECGINIGGEVEEILKAACRIEKPADRRKALRRMIRLILRGWKEEGILPWIALVAASQDGMKPSTLARCMSHRRHLEPGLLAMSEGDALSRLEELHGLANGLFLKRVQPTQFEIEETRYDEVPGSVFMFEPSIARLIRYVLAQGEDDSDWPEELRRSSRYVAIEARSRSRYRMLKGLRLRRDRQQVPERTIQAMTALMLSIDKFPDTANLKSLHGQTIREIDTRLCSDRVFTADDDLFDPVVAVHYVVQTMLGTEADRNGRLSMMLDADELRLSVYLLLFSKLGERRIWELHEIARGQLPSFLGKEMPAHFGHFTGPQQAKLLTRLGMAAAATAHVPILVWAEWQLILLHRSSERNTSYSALEGRSRVAAARLEIEARVGRLGAFAPYFLSRDLGRIGRKGLKKINTPPCEGEGAEALLKHWLAYLKVITDEASKIADKSIRWRIIDRLAVRVAELGALVSNGLSTPLLDEAPRRLGRTGRIDLRRRLGLFPLLNASLPEVQDRKAIATRARALLHANVSRLSVFGGAERSLVELDHAIALFLDGDIVEAVEAVSRARNSALRGSAGINVKVEILLIEIGVVLSAVELGVQNAPLSRIKLSLDYLDRLANDLASGAQDADARPHDSLLRAAALAARGRYQSLTGRSDPAYSRQAASMARRLGANRFADVIAQNQME